MHTLLFVLAGTACGTASATATFSKSNDLVIAGATTGYWAHISLATLTPSEAVVCFNDIANGFKGTCWHLTVDLADGSIAKGIGLVVNPGTMHYNSLAAVSSSALNWCYRDTAENYKHNCNHISVSGTTLTAGPDLQVDDNCNYHWATALGASGKSISCSDHDAIPTCHVLSASGTTLSTGTGLVVDNAGNSGGFSVSGLSDSTAIACNSDGTNSKYLTCRVLSVSGTTLTASPGVVVYEGNSAQAVEVAALTSSTAIVCYKNTQNNNAGTCKHLSISGTTILRSAPLFPERPGGVFHHAHRDDLVVSGLLLPQLRQQLLPDLQSYHCGWHIAHEKR